MIKTPAEYVNPYIGTIGHLLTSTRPVTMLPHGTAQVFPHVNPTSGDYYFAERVKAFPIDSLEIMFGDEKTEKLSDCISRFDMSAVVSHPYSFELYCEDSDINIEATITMRSYVYRAKNAKKAYIEGRNVSEIKTCDKGVMVSLTGFPTYILITVPDGAVCEIDKNSITITNLSDCVEIKASVSHISEEKSCEIFEREVERKNFDTVACEAKAVWEDLLGRIKVEGCDENTKSAFYTAFYRSFGKMTNYSEYGSYYSGYDKSVHDGEFYTNDQLWDSFRCMHPLQLLIEPDNHKKMLESYLNMYIQSGAMPSFPYAESDRPCMVGFHASALFADALVKGFDVDYAKAYEGLYRSATQTTMLPWVADKPSNELDQCYYEKGFFPALEIGQKEWVKDTHDFEARQAVAVTLEHSYDDWCIAQLAKHLGKDAEYEKFMKRSKNYQNVYNTETGFMTPKNADGEWIKGYDPMLGGGQGGRDYFSECNAYTFNFSVWHDIEGLAELMGGKDGMCDKLDELFTTPSPNKYYFLKQFPDSTGLMGMFCMGNEPSFHIPYFYDYAGKPWLTQRRIRMITELWFTNSPLGICGDEDSGAMSSWLVFTGMGFYPVCPGKSEYAIGTPMFDKMELKVPNGTFTVIADGASAGKRYIESATLNGQPYNKAFIEHKDIISGGELVLTMSDKPNRNWGVER